jgi:hypothetical protein
MLQLTAMSRNVNIPWPTKGMGDGDYMFAFQQVVMPIAYEFDPDFVIGRAPSDLVESFTNSEQSQPASMRLLEMSWVVVL